jgi:Fe-S cluster assembly scaffold protein SufB
VFVDGAFRDDLSARQELPDAFFVRCAEKDDGYALTLQGQTCLAIDPIELLFVTTAHGVAGAAPTKINVSLGQSSRLTLIERHVEGDSLPLAGRAREGGVRLGVNAQVVSSVVPPPPLRPSQELRSPPSPQGGGVLDVKARSLHLVLSLEAQAKLVHGKIVTCGDHFAQAQVSVAAGAFYDYFGLVVGGQDIHCEKTVELLGELAEARFSGVMLLRGAAHGVMTTLVRHLAPNGISRQVCKTVLEDKAHGAFEGKVFVDRLAQKTDAYQLCRALLLSDKAEMEAKPELEIYADDVKCSHGATMGALDENALFYLLSRGIDPEAARSVLVKAFVGEMVDAIQSPDLAGTVREEVQKWLA